MPSSWQSQVARLLSEIVDLRSELATLAQRLDLVVATLPALPADATAAHLAREAAKLRGFFWVDEFAAVIGRHRQYVSDRCAARVIKTMKGGKPYRIPFEEEAKWNRAG